MAKNIYLWFAAAGFILSISIGNFVFARVWDVLFPLLEEVASPHWLAIIVAIPILLVILGFTALSTQQLADMSCRFKPCDCRKAEPSAEAQESEKYDKGWRLIIERRGK